MAKPMTTGEEKREKFTEILHDAQQALSVTDNPVDRFLDKLERRQVFEQGEPGKIAVEIARLQERNQDHLSRLSELLDGLTPPKDNVSR